MPRRWLARSVGLRSLSRLTNPCPAAPCLSQRCSCSKGFALKAFVSLLFGASTRLL